MAQNRRQRARDGRAENEGGDGEQVDELRVVSDAEDGAGDDEAAGDLGDEEAKQRNERASIDVSGDVSQGWRQELAGSLRQRRAGRRLIHANPSLDVALASQRPRGTSAVAASSGVAVASMRVFRACSAPDNRLFWRLAVD